MTERTEKHWPWVARVLCLCAVTFLLALVSVDAGRQVTALPAVFALTQDEDAVTNGPADSSEQGEKDEEEEEITIFGDHFRRDGKTKVDRFWGNVRAIQEDTVFTCDEIEYNRETKKGVCRGNIRITDPDGTIVGDHVEFDTEEKVASVVQNVVMKYFPKDENGENDDLESEIEGDVTIECERLDYYYKKKIARVPVRVKIWDDKRTLTGDEGTYERKTDIAEVKGHVYVLEKDGRTVRADWARASFADEDEWVEAENAVYVGPLEEEEEEGEPSSGE